MCGIFGLARADAIQFSEARRMSALLRHRGPDDEGFLAVSDVVTAYGGDDTPASAYASPHSYAPARVLPTEGQLPGPALILGHRRLSIVDLTVAGHQPMSHRGRYWVVFNGEIYNFRELRLELAAAGWSFETETDTEVLLAAYVHWGVACLDRFNGMWALALYDSKNGTLFLARDRFGVKPLYYRQSAESFAFASEIKAFTALRDWQARAEIERLGQFLAWSITDHDERTMFEGVFQIPAGTYCRISLDAPGAPMGIVRWYTPSALPVTRADPAEELRGHVIDSVRLRLTADVPVGSCLSGGLDSSTIVCVLNRELRSHDPAARVHTVTARSADIEFDEGGYARCVANEVGAVAAEVTPDPASLFDELDDLVWHQDEPFTSSSTYAQWNVFRVAARKGLTVMLDGQGADEIFGGYRGFFGARLAGCVRRRELREWLDEAKAMARLADFSLLRAAGYTVAYLIPGLARLIGRFDGRAYSDLSWLQPACASSVASDPAVRSGGRSHNMAALSRAQVMSTSLPMLLHWEDRCSMAFSIEARVPFLDYRVVEFGIGLNDRDKVDRGIAKVALRRAMRGIVPGPVLDRRDKMGFVTAEQKWLQRDVTDRFREELALAVTAMPSLVSPRIVEMFEEVVVGKRKFDFRYWRVITAARWVRLFAIQNVGAI
jgi:asparagine synthase (glutamine-hydrolysing)